MAYKRPPNFNHLEFRSQMGEYLADPAVSSTYLDYLSSAVDGQGRYLPFDDFRMRVRKPANENVAWLFKRLARHNQSFKVMEIGDDRAPATLHVTADMQRICSLVDKNATVAALTVMKQEFGEERYADYLLQDLVDEESISSSQLEGAATTTIVAKEMLSEKRKPRTPDERMVLGNWHMMKKAMELSDRPLSIELLLELHSAGVLGIDDEKYTPGEFRTKDDVVVEDGEGGVVHTPPLAAGIRDRLMRLCEWANTPHDGPDSPNYIHPLIKAMILHFNIGFEHPFRDGNGRVARALFYWFMFKHGYRTFEFVSISALLKKAATAYGKSYVHTEHDALDLTYFVHYQCGIVERALDGFLDRFGDGLRKMLATEMAVRSQMKITPKDLDVAMALAAKSASGSESTVSALSKTTGAAYNTVSGAIKKLEKGQMVVEREGKRYSISPSLADEILDKALSIVTGPSTSDMAKIFGSEFSRMDRLARKNALLKK